MLRLTRGIVGLTLLAAACDPGGGATTPPPPSTAVTTAATVTEAPPETAPPSTGAADVLAMFTADLNQGDATAAFARFARDATWALGGFELRLGDPLPGDLAWLAGVVGVPEPTVDGVVGGLLQLQVAMQTRLSVSGCRGDLSMQTCDYSIADALTAVVGAERTGSISVQVSDGHIVRYESDDAPVGDLAGAPDEFKRWSVVRDPNAARDLPLLDWATVVVTLAEAWQAGGRPDVPPALTSDDPVVIVRAFLDFRNGGDWEAMVSLLGGAALDDPFGSRDEFDAAQLLERDITLDECGIVLESASGILVGCDVSVTDIIVAAAGATATNPNQSTFGVSDGRVTSLPQFLPSSFIAERAVEEWAEANDAEAYLEACPDGIAGQSPIDGLACAQFIADTQELWMPVVGALDL